MARSPFVLVVAAHVLVLAVVLDGVQGWVVTVPPLRTAPGHGQRTPTKDAFGEERVIIRGAREGTARATVSYSDPSLRTPLDDHVPQEEGRSHTPTISSVHVTFASPSVHVVDVLYAGEGGDSCMFLLASDNSVYSSSDNGASWFNINGRLPNFAQTSGVVAIERSPVEENMIFFAGSSGRAWTSEDCGLTFDYRSQLPKARTIVLSPNVEGDFMVIDNVMKLYFCVDWSDTCYALDENVLAAAYTPAHQWGMYWMARQDDNSYAIVMTDQQGIVDKVMLPHVLGFGATGNYLFGVTADRGDGGANLWVSSDGITMTDTALPTELTEKWYGIMAASGSTLFLAVYSGTGATPDVADLYLSDSSGVYYALTLSSLVVTSSGFDVAAVNSLPGVYVANYYDGEVEDDNIDTAVSFNEGAMWSPLTPPSSASCKFPCSLHLHSYTTADDGRAILAPSSAVGLVVASGNTGVSLSRNHMQTFLSRDGGFTWAMVADGSNHYEFGDHGSLIVLASASDPTRVLQFSWDEGATWTEYPFAETAMYVTDIITAPDTSLLSFVITGYTSGTKYVTYAVDFSNYMERQCVGANSAGTPASDYEVWVPDFGAASSGCFLGQKIGYTRRKQNVNCTNGIEHEAVTVLSPCQCTAADFTCDEGYERQFDSKGTPTDCVLVDPSLANNKPFPDNCTYGDTKTITKGYVRLPGDGCVNGEYFEPELIMCRKNEPLPPSPPSRWSLAHFVVNLLWIALLAFATYVLNYHYLYQDYPPFMVRLYECFEGMCCRCCRRPQQRLAGDYGRLFEEGAGGNSLVAEDRESGWTHVKDPVQAKVPIHPSTAW